MRSQVKNISFAGLQVSSDRSRMNPPVPLMDSILAENLGVDGAYRHTPKRIVACGPVEPDCAILKWYELAAEDEPVPDEIKRLARTFLTRTSLEAKGLGFVILHRCGNDFYFLLVSTWRGNNEIWESVYYKDGARMADFALFPRDGAHKSTFCVWELAAVSHEQKAWTSFLLSPRDVSAAQAWLGDTYAGPA